jgi:hypothetical protein
MTVAEAMIIEERIVLLQEPGTVVRCDVVGISDHRRERLLTRFSDG